MDRDTVTPSVETIPGPRAREWTDHHHQFAAPSTYVYPFVWDPTAPAKGPFCTDIDGNTLLDFTSHVAAAPFGYNNSLLQDRADALGIDFSRTDPLKIAGQDFYAGSGTADDPDMLGPTHLLERITSITSHYGMDTVFLSNSGAEAVENAIKIAYADRDARRGVCFEGAFHGRTLGALSLNRSKEVHRRGFPEVPGIMSLPYCACEGSCSCVKTLLDVFTRQPTDDIAYIILEPVQGEGGYRLPNTEFLEALEEIRSDHGIHLIADEIQSGLGRTGEMWASDHYPITPDVITSAKGLRVGATISRSDVFPSETGRLSSTWGAGDIINSLWGVLTIDTIREENILAHATTQGEALLERLADLDHDCIVDTRGLGLMVALEFDTQAQRDDVVDAAFANGLLTLGCGEKTLRLLPPLDVRDRELELAVDLLSESINDAT